MKLGKNFNITKDYVQQTKPDYFVAAKSTPNQPHYPGKPSRYTVFGQLKGNKMLSTEQIITQLELQSKMNAIVNPDWINAGYPWLRAVMVEGAKAIDHLGYKWWKKQESNMAQVQLELVDIWHFYLSQKLVGCKTFSLVETAQELRRCLDVCFGSHCDPNDRVVEFDGEDYDLSSASLVKLLALIIAFAATGRMCVPAFAFAMKAAGLTPESLHKQYMNCSTQTAAPIWMEFLLMPGYDARAQRASS